MKIEFHASLSGTYFPRLRRRIVSNSPTERLLGPGRTKEAGIRTQITTLSLLLSLSDSVPL